MRNKLSELSHLVRFLALIPLLFLLHNAATQDCPKGKYGKDCLSTCLCSSLGTIDCDSVTGKCHCEDGFTGAICDVDIDECDLPITPCNRALTYCHNTFGSYDCLCSAGFTLSDVGYCTPCSTFRYGSNCSDICSCQSDNSLYCTGQGYCICKQGWTGVSCESSVDDCIGMNCNPGTFCVDKHRAAFCVCRKGYRVFKAECQEYTVHAVTLQPTPGVGELVDLYVLYNVPYWYRSLFPNVPDFVYQLMIDGPEKKKLCRHAFTQVAQEIFGNERFFEALKVDSNNYNYFAHVRLSFTEDKVITVRMIPESAEYDELVVTFDVRHKSQIEKDCLLGLNIVDTSNSTQNAPKYRRQSYNSFEIKRSPTRNCNLSPKYEWTYYKLTEEAVNQVQQEQCVSSRQMPEVKINEVILHSEEMAITDQKSEKEIIPKGIFKLGIHVICVKAYVPGNKRLSAGTCGYIEILPSHIILGSLNPRNSILVWPSTHDITLRALFYEPDLGSELGYQWTCIRKEGYDQTQVYCPSDRYPGNSDKYEYFLSRSDFRPFVTITMIVRVWLINYPSVRKSDKVQFLHTYGGHYMPTIIECYKTCGEVIGTNGNMVLGVSFKFGKYKYRGDLYFNWTITADDQVVSRTEYPDIFGNYYAAGSFENYKVSTASNSLKPGVKYKFYLKVVVDNWEWNPDFPTYKYFGEAEYSFEVEPAPQGDGCTLTPNTGEAVFTRFTLTCMNYVDTVARLPLMYKLYQLDKIPDLNTEIYTIIAYSGTGLIKNITLSNRGTSGVSDVQFIAEIINVKGTSERVPLSVTLTTLDQKQIIDRIVGNINVLGGGQEDTRSLKDIASVISTVASASYNDKVGVRQEVLKNLVKLDSESPETIEHVSHVLGISVEKEAELETPGLDSGINVGYNLASNLGKVGSNNFELTKKVAETQVNALSKLLNVVSVLGAGLSSVTEAQKPDASELKNKNMNQSFMATNSFGNIASVLLNLITSLNQTVQVSTQFMHFHIAWNNVSAKTSFKVETDEVKFHLPTEESGVLENEIVESEYEIFKKNPYGWTAPNVHGNLPVVKVNLMRQSEKTVKKDDDKSRRKTFRFSKPADIFLNYEASSSEKTHYAMVIKTVNQQNRKIVRKSSCVFMSVKVSKKSATVMKIFSPDNLKIMVKAKYTNVIKYFDNLDDEEMLEMPLSGPEGLSTTKGLLYRDNNLLFLPQLTKQQLKRNKHYRMKISVMLNQVVNTTSLQHIIGNKSKSSDVEESEEFYNVTIEATPHLMSCLHFNEAENDYLSNECLISMYSNLNVMYCRCVVAAAYTGSVVVLPRLINPLDIGLFLLVFDNPLVVSVVIAVWMIFFALISWARLRDKEDENRRAITVLDDNKDDHNYMYLICIVTGWAASASTTSNVFIYLKGSWSQSENHVLQDPVRRLYESGAENWFMLATKEDVGELLSVVVWTDFSGAQPSWFLNSIYVQNLHTNESWICVFNSWISEHFGSGKLLAEVPALKESDYASKWKVHIFNKSRNDIRNEHLWFGIIAKTSYNKFTRVRRLTTCLSLLQTLMILNLMFFGIRDKDDPGQFVEVLDQKIHVTSVIIGIQTSIIIFVLGVGISLLFNRVAPVPTTKKVSEETKDNLKDILQRRKSYDDGEDSNSSISGNEDENIVKWSLGFFKKKPQKKQGSQSSSDDDRNINYNKKKMSGSPNIADKTESEDSKESGKPANTVFMLPWWFIYVTWSLLIVYNIFLAYYVMLYGLSLGYEKSGEWVLAFLTGFMVNVLIIQPIKVILMVFLLVLFFKQRHSYKEQAPIAKLNDGIILVQQHKSYNRKYGSLHPSSRCKAPIYTAEAKNVLERLTIEAGAREMLRNLFVHTMFMITVILVAYGHSDVHNQYLQNQQVKNIFLGSPIYIQEAEVLTKSLLPSIVTVEDMWHYITNVVAPEMITEKSVSSSVHDSYIMGTARLRQIRKKSGGSGTCTQLPNILKNLFDNASCTYSTFIVKEETNSFNKTWTILANSSNVEEIDDTPYVYRSPKDLNSAPFIGHHGVYSGGGYVLTFGRDDINAVKASLIKLYNSDWIDHFTRCLFVEFTLYNPGSGYFTSVLIAFEFDNFGAIFPYATVQSAQFFNSESEKQMWLRLSEGFLVICTLFYTIVEIQALLIKGCSQYFKNIWSYVEIATIVLAYTVQVFFFLRFAEFVDILKGFQKYGHTHFMDFRLVFQMHSYLIVSLALLQAVVIFKMLKVTAFNPYVSITFRTFSLSGGDIFGMLFVTLIFLFNFALTGFLMFGSVVESYMSLDRGFFTLLFFILGWADYESLVEVNLFLGRIYYVLIVGVSQYLILNFFCSILKESYDLTRYMAFKREQETRKYLFNLIKFYAGFGPKNKRLSSAQ